MNKGNIQKTRKKKTKDNVGEEEISVQKHKRKKKKKSRKVDGLTVKKTQKMELTTQLQTQAGTVGIHFGVIILEKT